MEVSTVGEVSEAREIVRAWLAEQMVSRRRMRDRPSDRVLVAIQVLLEAT